MHSGQPSLYYITFTCHQWLPLFEITNSYDLVYNWYEVIKIKYGIKTTDYIIMLNHVHCILFFPTEKYDLNKIVSNGKRFMAYEIVKRLDAALWSQKVFKQKLDYIHNNPVAAGFCDFADDYYYSSASFYKNASNTWLFLTHYQV